MIDMDIQLNLELAIHKLVTEFIDDPYRYFTEADAVSRFHEILETDPVFNQQIQTKDGYKIPLVHQEYPTFFRFDDAKPVARLGPESKSKRGHYDVVVLNPEFLVTHEAEIVKNRNIASVRDENINPLKAIVEFKLDDRGWSNGKANGAIAEMGKLILSRQEAMLRYFVVLMRYTATTRNRWDKYWGQIIQAATERLEIGSIFATHWISIKHNPQVHSFGNWLSKYEEKHSLSL